ncbi:MAG: IS1595 family transposase, partial [Mucispirillum sp.]|nr:IS1595 family transposase [Mucispirillum sp.]
FAKRRLSKFNGLTGEKFILHLKESEIRFNI